MPFKPIPREVSKWLQSLDLSYKITNPKRDLSNGFLVAEILSRKHDSGISMNSFVYGTSTEVKKANWACLKKLNKRKKWMPIPDKLVDDMINESPNVGYNLLLDLFNYMNHRKVAVIGQPDESNPYEKYDLSLPSIMRPTASLLAKNKELHRIDEKMTRGEYLKRQLDVILKQIQSPEKLTVSDKMLIQKTFRTPTEIARLERLLLSKPTNDPKQLAKLKHLIINKSNITAADIKEIFDSNDKKSVMTDEEIKSKPIEEIFKLGQQPTLEQVLQRHRQDLAESRKIFQKRADRFDPPSFKKTGLNEMEELDESHIPKKEGDDSKFLDMEMENNQVLL